MPDGCRFMRSSWYFPGSSETLFVRPDPALIGLSARFKALHGIFEIASFRRSFCFLPPAALHGIFKKHENQPVFGSFNGCRRAPASWYFGPGAVLGGISGVWGSLPLAAPAPSLRFLKSCQLFDFLISAAPVGPHGIFERAGFCLVSGLRGFRILRKLADFENWEIHFFVLDRARGGIKVASYKKL